MFSPSVEIISYALILQYVKMYQDVILSNLGDMCHVHNNLTLSLSLSFSLPHCYHIMIKNHLCLNDSVKGFTKSIPM